MRGLSHSHADIAMLTSKIRLFALLSSTLICSAAPMHAQVITTIDAAGLQALMAHSAVYVERTAIQRPDPNVMANSEGGLLGEPVSPAVANALGCLIAGSIGTGIAAMAGTKNVVNIIAGGHVVP